MKKPEIPDGWRELEKREVITTDDKIWSWDQGPWKYVGGSLIGTRYQVPNADTDSHWAIIREIPDTRG